MCRQLSLKRVGPRRYASPILASMHSSAYRNQKPCNEVAFQVAIFVAYYCINEIQRCRDMKKKINLLYYYYPVLSPKTPLDCRPLFLENADELAQALLPTTSYFAISSILVGYFKLPISRRFIRLSLHKAAIGT